jgi:hypothetical protein
VSVIGGRAQERKVVELTVRAMRKAAEIPRTTNNDSAYNNITMGNKLSFGSAGGTRRQYSHRDGLDALANSVNQPLAC